jgi:hypothetical protein
MGHERSLPYSIQLPSFEGSPPSNAFVEVIAREQNE